MSKDYIVEKDAAGFHPRIANGELVLSVFMTNQCDEDLDEALVKWLEHEESVGISWNFKASAILDSLIEFNENPADKTIDIESKPIFESLRAQLESMVSRIDALRYA